MAEVPFPILRESHHKKDDMQVASIRKDVAHQKYMYLND